MSRSPVGTCSFGTAAAASWTSPRSSTAPLCSRPATIRGTATRTQPTGGAAPSPRTSSPKPRHPATGPNTPPSGTPMHPEVLEWVGRWATDEPTSVLDIGGRDVNGTPRPLFPAASYTVLDARPGVNVDVVADAATWTPDREYDLVLCTEVFEHTAVWRETCAGPGRSPHSAIEATDLQPGEQYANIEPDELDKALLDAGFARVHVEQAGLDVRAEAVR